MIFKHREFLLSSGEFSQRRKQRAKLELAKAVESHVKDYVYQQLSKDNYFAKLVDDLVERKTDPHSAAMKIINQLNKELP